MGRPAYPYAWSNYLSSRELDGTYSQGTVDTIENREGIADSDGNGEAMAG
jgi:hypothetical protein